MKSSRRKFLRNAITVPLAARLGERPGGRTPAWAAGLPPATQMQFQNPHMIRYDSSCFTINDNDTIVFSGAFHYPRCPKALWRDRLQKFKPAGFNTIETYVFWNYHEPEQGKGDLTEFEDFIKLVHEMGFYIIARPGPYVCAEWERGGFPDWVAAMRFPLRSNHPESIEPRSTGMARSFPIIQRHQITVGGPIIMVQVENEYDFCPPSPTPTSANTSAPWPRWFGGPASTCPSSLVGPSRRVRIPIPTWRGSWTRAISTRAGTSWGGGSRAGETCAWKSLLLRSAITELQGGWFSQFGGRLSVDQEGVNAAQINMLTKTVLEMGVTYFSYYMGFGGTNFDWAAKNLTTTYDYAAPIREPGGLWDKYYAARGICQSLRVFGAVLTRAQELKGAECSNPNVSLTRTVNGPSAVLFVRENSNAAQRYKITFTDPHSPSKRKITAPREHELEIGPREMKMLPVQIPVSGGRLCYSTAEVLAHGVNLDRDFLILYDAPGRMAEISFAT